MKRFVVRSLFALLSLSLVACGSKQRQPADPPVEEKQREAEQPDIVELKLLAFNDLHGHLTGPSGSVRVKGTKLDAGGADHLAERVAAIRADHPNTLVVTAGDMIGASPLLSALFHDEPTIEALNAMELDAASVGNHEFDEGVDELVRMQNGGCHPEDGCQDGDDFGGASFPFLAANVTYKETGETLFPAYVVKEVDGVPVAFIGLTLEGTPSIVSPEGIKAVDFHDEVETINATVEELQEKGIHAIVVLIHEGGIPTEEQTDVNQCPGVSGPINAIVENSDDDVDVFVTGHTHRAYVCEIDGRLVTAAKSYGRLLTRIDVELDRASSDIATAEARNIVVDREGDPHPDVAALVDKYRKIVAPFANEPIGTIENDIPRAADDSGDSPLGELIADIQLWATTGPQKGRAQIAFMNPGGVRADLELDPSDDEKPGVVTYSEAHTVQPFGNSLVTMSLTGEQIHDMLEMQWDEEAHARVLQPSRGFTYGWSPDAPVGDRVDPASMKLRGDPIDPEQTYRVTVNSFLANGGDGFTILEQGTDRVGGLVDLQAFVRYFREHSPIAAPDDDRIRLESSK